MILGVLGGSFDPVHLGHVALVTEVLAADLAERILVVPAWLSPHKSRVEVAADHRLAMVELAFAGLDGVQIDRREIAAGRVCYTVDTLSALAAENPATDMRLVVGADNLKSLTTWQQPHRLLELAEIVVAGRGEWLASVEALVDEGLPADRFLFLPHFRHPASSTLIRQKLAAGELPQDLLPAAVAAYMRNQGLYGLSGRG